VQYTYDALNRMATVTDWQTRTTAYSYDDAGRPLSQTNPNGTYTVYGFDAANRLTGLANRKSNDAVISEYAYTLDPQGNHLHVTQTEPLEPPVPTPRNIAYSYDVENRLTSAGTTLFAYDNKGSLLTKGTDDFAYDPANRLSSSTIGGVASTYRYDGGGNRLERVAGGSTTRYVQNTNRALPAILAETDGSGSITSYYVYGLGLHSKVLAVGTAYYFHFDSRGSAVALTDAAQNVTDAYAYGQFGEVVASSGSTSNPFGYLGKHGVVGDGNGMLQVRARYYLAETGRFLTKDPLTGKDGDGQSLHRYVYAVNNPLRLIDVSGFSAKEISINLNLDPDVLLKNISNIEGSLVDVMDFVSKYHDLLLDIEKNPTILQLIEQKEYAKYSEVVGNLANVVKFCEIIGMPFDIFFSGLYGVKPETTPLEAIKAAYDLSKMVLTGGIELAVTSGELLWNSVGLFKDAAGSAVYLWKNW
jgi:RHS repeat-associated protein